MDELKSKDYYKQELIDKINKIDNANLLRFIFVFVCDMMKYK